ncbi:diadenylate cyclase [Paenibacillus odorifer]|uniref:diadenylate cyclase n=1 Tax=Paenibacillus TaxID=44249 RepID=UPI00096E5CFA|nr:diadenylate cyclase [Paenibacillus odorifer]OMC92079.1 hypothetical protein BJP46_09765 [Paenibacillus odorifer]OME26404.1 hypothetical protein BSK57_08945 [Paenibacillus odorifer]
MKKRVISKETQEELIYQLSLIFSIKGCTALGKSEIESLLKENSFTNKYLFWDDINKDVVAVLFDEREAIYGMKLKTLRKPADLDIFFGNLFCRVFNNDIQVFPDADKNLEHWYSLGDSRFRRAIAKFSAFSTEPMLNWMQTIESSVNLTYEGTPFSYCLFMTKQKEWIQNKLTGRFVDFKKHIPFRRALLSEKWIRAATLSHIIGIAGLGFSGDIFGMYSIPENDLNESDFILTPHEKIRPIVNLITPGTCMFLTTTYGDIYTILPNKAIFLKTKGKWRYLNYYNILGVLEEFLEGSIAKEVIQLTLNLSYERSGALIAIPDKDEFIQQMVPDFAKSHTNRELRSSLNGLNISNSANRTVIMAASKIDGAIILSKTGILLDVACMITEPTKESLEKIGLTELMRHSGARSTAAWNSSVFGIAIKISEDGPISIFKHGILLEEIG